ncbi:Cpe/LpqF family protein [Cellulomonas bogoriensis]|uniref:Uncharacterized protein n=1 Tax=Cellulomonas bogoriensis 69B4 = DSM 16987 TaxID=1386082 RepID=A0A0A0BZ64_9CELL|nr:Cpe/LpqF family protein [Cellulomonas bogoriensis]KGM13196.1 hypothetical protein N869_15710 [Cellulomonas bogoriensis 69B4 = DSM 16987]
MALLLGATMVVAGCTAADAPPAPEQTGGPVVAEGVELPDHPAGRAAEWVLDLLNGAGPPALTEDDLERFDDAFVEQISRADLEEVFVELHGDGPWTVTDVGGVEPAVVALLDSPTAEYEMTVVVDDDGRISTLWFGEPTPRREEATSWEGLHEEVAVLDGETSLYVARVEDGACVPVRDTPVGTSPGDPLPIGSMIKLYVLGAVVGAVQDGELGWDDELTVTDALRSLPSGQLQDAPAGTTVTVREAALEMIRISDNTATDLLVDAVGRERVEQALADMGMADPSVNVPVATTRELFHLGWGGEPGLHTGWREGGETERREILDTLPEGPPAIDPATIMNDPVWSLGIDWFATAEDLCAAHVALQDLADTPAGEPVREVLAAEPGVDVDAELWPYVGFKGGSAPGTMGGAWYAEDADGQGWVVVFQSASLAAARAVPGPTMVGVAQDALRLAP